jgi:hypothetical protein
MSVRHQPRIVSDEDLEKALDWLRDRARDLGDAKAESIRASHMIKVVKALGMKLHNEKPVSHQEREAMASEEFRAALERDAIAAGSYETLRALREAAALKVEAWRSEQANFRALKI